MKMMKKITFLVVMVFALAVPSVATEYVPPVLDFAELLTPQEEALLVEQIRQLKTAYGYDFGVLVLDDATLSQELQNDVKYDYAPLYFQENRFVFALNMGNRRMAIEVNGTARDEVSDNDTTAITDKAAHHFTNGNYYQGFADMLDLTEGHLDGSVDFQEKLPLYGISLVSALLVAAAVTWWNVKKMNNVEQQDRASGYITQAEFKITLDRETYLYRNVVKTPKQTNNGSGRGGGGGRSSGGTSRGF